MWTKRILILLPLAVCVFLVQSYFWVPTYEMQAKATPERLNQFITASIGDAEILNPILNADTASSTICGLVFEGLIDRDENLNFRGRLAESWNITEKAYFIPSPNDRREIGEIAGLIRSAITRRASEDAPLGRSLRNISKVEIQPAGKITHTVTEQIPAGKGKGSREILLSIKINRPERIKLTLEEVDQDVFVNLEKILGKDYFSGIDTGRYVEVQPAEFSDFKARAAEHYLPATEHNPVIVFRLRKGVKFHDGHEFDSGDVKFTYDSIIEPKNLSPRVPDYEPVKSVELVDKYTVRITYRRLYSPAFGTWGMEILPEHLLNESELKREAKARRISPDDFSLRKSHFNRNPIGCGPFIFVEWKSDERIKLTRFDNYWEGAPEYKEYVYRVIPDKPTQEMEFYAGAVDNYGAEPHQVARLREDERFQDFSGLSFGYTYIGYNMRREPFKDVRVRKALGMAIDVGKILKYVMYGQAERMTGPFPKQTEFYDHSIEPIPYDPAGAVRLLEEAGWKRNEDGWFEKDGKRLEFTLITNNGNPTRKDVLTIAQDSWKKIGIDVKTDLLEWAVFIGKHVDQGDFDAVVLGWSMGIDPDLYQIWHSSQTNPHQLNFVAFANEEADDLIVRIRQEYDREKQAKMCHRLHRIIAEEQPYTFLFVSRWTALLDKRIFIVKRDRGDEGKIVGYEKIKPTKTGNYMYHFNRWAKVSHEPELVAE